MSLQISAEKQEDKPTYLNFKGYTFNSNRLLKVFTLAYYHIRIESEGFPSLTNKEPMLHHERRDLLKDEVLFSYVLPYILDETFYVNGVPFPAPATKTEKRRLWAYCTVETAAIFCHRVENGDPELMRQPRIQTIQTFSDNINNQIFLEAQMLRYGQRPDPEQGG